MILARRLSASGNSQPIVDSKASVTPVSSGPNVVSDIVAQVAAEVAARMAVTKRGKAKNRTDVEKALKASQKGTMKWLTFMSSFVLEKMWSLIKTGMRTDKGFKEVHLTTVAKALFEHCGVDVSSTQVYNHLRKWRQRWLIIAMLRDLSGAQWCEESKTILLEAEHYHGHVTVRMNCPQH